MLIEAREPVTLSFLLCYCHGIYSQAKLLLEVYGWNFRPLFGFQDKMNQEYRALNSVNSTLNLRRDAASKLYV